MKYSNMALPLFAALFLVISIILIFFHSSHASQNTSLSNVSNETYPANHLTSKSSSLKSNESLDETGRSFGSTFNLSNNIGHSELPQIYANKNYVYVLWIDNSLENRDIYFKRSTNGGVSFNKTINLSNNTGGSLDPQMTISGNNVYVIWEHAPGNNGEIYFARSANNGANFSKFVNIGNNSGLNGLPEISSSNNNVYAVWHDASHGLIFRRSTDNGTTFEKAVALSKNILSFDPHIATISGTNNLYIVWLTPSSSNQSATYNINFRRSIDGGSTFQEAVTLSRKDILSFDPHIATAPGTNSVYVVWQNGSVVRYIPTQQELITDVLYARSTDNGTTFESALNLSNHTGWATKPQIAVSQGNDVYVVWQNNPQGKNGEIVFRRSVDNGTTFEEAVLLSNKTWNPSHPQIAISQGNDVYVVWNDNSTGNNEINLTVSHAGNHSSQKKIGAKAELSDSSNGKFPKTVNIALIEPTFTKAAYDKSFYVFFNLKKDLLGLPFEKNITRYTNLLYSTIYNQPSKELIESNECPCDLIVKHLEQLSPLFNVSVLRDEDVHTNSHMFSKDGTNRYDVIILVHQEYVTQQEYNNLKQFVANGGTMILLDGNVFYAEVKYNQETNMISLVKGHGWAFNGKSAWKSVNERWANESSQWIGSNYLCCYGDTINFANNPFNYTHNEEQHITNPNAKILLDYNATLFKHRNATTYVSYPKIATYEIEYKKGKVIGLGLYSDDLVWPNNERFMKFFDSLLFKYARVE